MRVDKFLKVSRLIKRREVAKELCDAGYVLLNGKEAKPASDIKAGDVLKLRLGQRELEVKALSILPYAGKEQATTMYEVLSDSKRNRGNDDA